MPGVKRRGKDEQAGQGGFQVSETILYDTAMVDMRHYAFVQTQ